jgi:flagellar hook-associated protein 2
MALGLDGLASGLPTTELIKSLLAIDAIPQTLLKNKVTSANTQITALQGLNTKIAALGALAATTAKPTSLDFYTATSSSPAVTATATTGASGGEIDVVVGALAQSQAGVTAPMASWSSPPVITIVAADGTAKEITATSNSLDDVIKAVNAAGAGVSATKVASGSDPATGEKLFRLQFTGTATGANAAFSVLQGTHAGGADIIAATTRTAQDASVTLWSGTAAEQKITSTTNTFADLLPGVSVTVSAVSATPVKVTVARDTAKVSEAAATLVKALNDSLAYIATRSASTTTTDAEGNPMTVGGAFTGSSLTRDLTRNALAAASAPIGGKSPSEYGISITKTGTMEFDAVKFAAAYAKDPALVQGVVAEIATRIAAVAETASDKYTGTITSKVTGQESTVRNLTEQVARWDDRLASRKSNLERMYSAFEVRMSNMNAQMTWLTSQVDNLQAQKG